MAYELEVTREYNKFTVKTQEFSFTLPDIEENRKVAVVFLRLLEDEGGKKLFRFEELKKIVNSENRQCASWHVEKFRESGEDFSEFLKRKRKVDEEVVSAIRLEVRKDPLVNEEELAERVNKVLKREDISSGNVRAGLEQISSVEVRSAMREQLEKGEVRYKEEYLLKEVFSALESGDSKEEEVIVSQVKRGKVIEKMEEKMEGNKMKEGKGMSVRVIPREIVKNLLVPDMSISGAGALICWLAFVMVLYYNGVSLSVLGSWCGVDKSTILRWIVGLAIGLWEVISIWFKNGIKGSIIYLDEKWIKIKSKWHYWFVALDDETGLPVFWKLMKGRSNWNCLWIVLKLKSMGLKVRVFVTDGLAGYAFAIGRVFKNATHQLCHFHHQQNVTKWLKKHFTDEKEIQKRKKVMKKVLQTNDKRTTKRRIEKLYLTGLALNIADWVKETISVLPKLLPAIGSRWIPKTSNAIERFFRAFNRFYKMHKNFFSIISAEKQFILFVILYSFTKQKNGIAPIESIFPEANRTLFYKIVNDPFKTLGFVKQNGFLTNISANHDCNSLIYLKC